MKMKHFKKRSIMLWVLWFFLLTGIPVLGSVSGPRVISYKLDVGFYPEARMDYAGLIGVLYGQRPNWNKEDSVKNYPHMKGTAVMEVDLGNAPVDTLDFFIQGELRAHWVTCDGKMLDFGQQSECYAFSYSLVATRVTVKLDGLSGRHRFEMAYGGLFNPSCAGSPSSYMRIDTEGAYLRAYGYSLWFPFLLKSGDDTHAVDFPSVKIRTSPKFTPVFTGERVNEKMTGGEKVSFWRATGVNLFDAGVNVRPYRVTDNRGIFLYHLDNPRSAEASRDIGAFVNKLLAFYSDHYKKIKSASQLHIAELPNFASGISNGNMVGITSGQWRRFSLADSDMEMELLVSHELVHPFVQPEISMRSPLAALFIEGFPSYFHLHALGEIVGEEWYRHYMSRVEESYIRKKKTGKSRRGGNLPEEKPILSITFNEIGRYKDTFILNDRVRLFLNYLRKKSGKDMFRKFTRELCVSEHLNPGDFVKMIVRFLPDSEKDVKIWLETNDYPDHLHLKH